MRIRTLSIVLLLALATLPPFAAAQDLRGPVMGYVLDAGVRAIRPINGIPGSSSLGLALDLPFSVAAAAFSPRGDFALAVSASEDHRVYMLGSLGGVAKIDAVEGGIGGVDRIVFNGNASVAALIASDAHRLQMLSGLPDSVTVGATLDLSSIAGTISAIAINQTGSNILIAASADHGGLYLAAADAQTAPRLIADFGSPAALTLLHGDQDVIVADAALNELTLLRNFAGTPDVVRLATERDGISGPTGLQLSTDGARLYVANATSRTLDVWNLETQSIESRLTLDAKPTQLIPFRGTAHFVLNEVGDHPLLLLNTTDSPAVFFVPGGRNQ